MDLKGSLIDTNIKIYPSNNLLNYLKTLSNDDMPENFIKILNIEDYKPKLDLKKRDIKPSVNLSNKDIENLEQIKKEVNAAKIDTEANEVISEEAKNCSDEIKNNNHDKDKTSEKINDENDTKDKLKIELKSEEPQKNDGPYIMTSDVDWLYSHLQSRRAAGEKQIPYLHVLLEGAKIEMPENSIIKRNPLLEARCVKLRAQQEAREYRKMTKGVDNVRMRFPEESISYQLKQVNRQLIAVGQFVISIFAGFLFGFRGVEWMVGNLDFGFRLLLGVICALIIALAEIYFLAKQLNEELNIPETTQLGGPPKFVETPDYLKRVSNSLLGKEHQD